MSAFDEMRDKEGVAAEALALLRPLFEYDPLSGDFIWRQDAKFGQHKAGSVAGSLNHAGYVRIKVKGRIWFAHRLVWLFTFGEWPDGQIDHINGVRNDNRLVNLRAVDPRGNSSNAAKHRNGHPVGVTFHKQYGWWRASIYDCGERFHLGYFQTAAEAALAYQLALKDLQLGYAEMEKENV